MGQTLSNGVYLPNEGERNCYAGLASNWQILNTAVGNIAEKAPLVHTHGNITNDGKVGTNANLPLITGTGGAITAGAFGNQANTFCEGNDSRLSDARTPVAHTHTKSDVTDLLNSNFIPSANNSYDLGSSSYQWNNLYATTINTDTIQSVFGNLVIHSTGTDKAVFIHNGTNSGDGGGLFLYGKTHSNGSLVRLQIYNTTTSSYEAIDLASSSFYPYTNNLINLGTSTKKWKTFNGLNPGALSLPDYDETKAISVDTTGWTYDGSTANQLKINNATQTINGWLFIRIENVASTDRVIIRFNSNLASDPAMGFSPASTGINLIMPIPANKITNIYLTKSPMRIKFYPCLGNV